MDSPGQKYELPIKTRDGEFVAVYSLRGLCGMHFPGRVWTNCDAGTAVPQHLQNWHALTVKALFSAIEGEPIKQLPPLDLSSGTNFQRSVWEAMLRIPPGNTWTYGQVASAIGKPKAVRAVGRACGANPIPLFLPCHGVVAA